MTDLLKKLSEAEPLNTAERLYLTQLVIADRQTHDMDEEGFCTSHRSWQCLLDGAMVRA